MVAGIFQGKSRSRTVARIGFLVNAEQDVAQKLRMAASGIGVAPPVAAPATRRGTAAPRGVRRRPFYIGVSLLMALIAVVGFWPTYFGPLVRGTINQPLLIHLHATVFSGWLVLFATQVVLAARGRIAWHLRLGRIGIGYGVLVVIVGLLTGLSRSAHRLSLGLNGDALLFVSIADMTVFSVFFGAAIAYRRKPQIHKRLMMVAATMLLVAAASRMTFLPLREIRQAVWVLPILLAMAYDVRTQRVIHPVYVTGLAAFFIRAVSPGLVADTAAWSAVARWLIAFAA